MSEIDTTQIDNLLSKWHRNDYITHVRSSVVGGLILEVPPAIRSEIDIEPGAEVEWKRLEDGSLSVTISPPVKYDIADLVAGITPENRHEYTDTGNPVGNEVW